jgi:hypothetical protein
LVNTITENFYRANEQYLAMQDSCANRAFIINIHAVAQYIIIFSGKLKLELKSPAEKGVLSAKKG